MHTTKPGSDGAPSGAKPLVLGLNPSPIMPDQAWFEGANTTGALAFLAFDTPHWPTECRRWFDLRNLNERIVDRDNVSRIDPVEAMTRLTSWAEQGLLSGPLVTCGVTVSLTLRAFVEATGVRGVRHFAIPHPSVLWSRRRSLPVKRWDRARSILRDALGLPALPEVDEYAIDNALVGFGSFVNLLEMERIMADDAAFENASDADEELEETEYSAVSPIHDLDTPLYDAMEHAQRLVDDGSYYD